MKKIQGKFTRIAAFILALVFIVSAAAFTVSADEKPKILTYYNITNPYADVDWDSFGQYKANLHTHTFVSNDVSSNANNVRNMVEAYYAAGYDILSINDHANISRPWDQYAAANGPLTTERYQEILTGVGRDGRGMVDVPLSNEQNNMVRGRHVLSYFANFNVNNPVSALTGLFANLATYEQVFAGINNVGGIGYVAHPGRELYGILDNGHRNFDGLAAHLADIFLRYPDAAYGYEIFGVLDSETHNDRVLWDRTLELTAPFGKNVFGISTDDAHATGEVGRGGSKTTFVMSENTADNVEAAMRSGAFYASSKMILNDRIGFERAFDFRNNSTPQPVISRISIDGNTISVEGEYYNTIEWISGVGNLVATGNSIDLLEYKDKIGSYIRFQLKGEGGISWANPMLLERVDAELVDAVPEAFVTRFNGNMNGLAISVVETYEYGEVIVITADFMIRNNAEGIYQVGDYRIFVDTKGNDQIRSIYIVSGLKVKGSAEEIEELVILAADDIIDIENEEYEVDDVVENDDEAELENEEKIESEFEIEKSENDEESNDELNEDEKSDGEDDEKESETEE